MKRLIVSMVFGAMAMTTLQGCMSVTFASGANASKSTADRRSAETIADDESIEWKACSRIRTKLGESSHVNCKAFNHKVLLTGEVPAQGAKDDAEAIVVSIPKVQKVHNYLTVGPVSSIGSRNVDALLTANAKMLGKDQGKLNKVHVQLVTEDAVIYMMGLVSQPEANAATDITRTTNKVKRVMPLMEIISEADAKKLDDEHAALKTF